jgi:GNAT superfamily N-acetyltransferase
MVNQSEQVLKRQMKLDIHMRESFPQEDSLIAEHFYKMWLDLEVPADYIEADWLNIMLKFISRARQEIGYKAFVADVEGRIVGSASCQLFAGLYPNILTENYRKYGYIWGVYVEPPYRRQGIATKLTSMTVDYLKSLGCTKALLNASPSGESVYSSLGFSVSNQMGLDLLTSCTWGGRTSRNSFPG